MGLFFTKDEDAIVAVLDINSGSVGGAIVLKNKNSLPLIVATSRHNYKLVSTPDGARLAREMLETLDLVCQDLQQKTGKRPEKVYCVMSTPWSHGELRSIKYEKSQEFQFTEAFAQKLIKKEIENFVIENAGLRHVMDKRITKVSLNGYVVDSPHGQSARTLTLDVFLSLSSQNIITDIEDRIHKTWKSRIAFTSQIFGDFMLVRDIFDAKNDFVIINIGAEITEVLLMKHDHLEGTAFFPYGTRNIIRAISVQLNKNVYETMSLFSLYGEDLLSPDSSTFIRAAVESAGDIWCSELRKLLADMSTSRHIPQSVFLIAPESMEAWIRSMITPKFFPEFTTAGREFSVIIPNREMLYNFCHYSDMADRDVPLSMKTIFINRV